MTHYARHDYFHNTQNGALSSDTGRISYSRISYETQTNKEYFSEPYALSNQGPEEYSRGYHLNSDTVPTTIDKSNNSYDYDYLECYGADIQCDPEEDSVDNWNENTSVAADQYGFEHENLKCTSSKLLPKLPNNKNVSGSSNACAPQMETKFKKEDAAQRDGCGFGMDQAVAMGSGSSTYEVYEKIPRPYTSMLPLDYSYYQECCNNTDNLSTYSDTPPSNNAQLKRQNQRKISLMMAMTTASVIASGSTISTNAAARDLNRCLAAEPCGVFDSGSVTNFPSTAVTTISKTRKLPKVLPTPLYKSSRHPITIDTDELNSSLYTSDPLPEKSHRPKQLPKLPKPLSQTKDHSSLDSNWTTLPVPDALTFDSLEQKSPPSPTTTTTITKEKETISYLSRTASIGARHNNLLYSYDSKEPNKAFLDKYVEAEPSPSWTPSSPIQSKQSLSPPVSLPSNSCHKVSLTCHLPEIETARSDIESAVNDLVIEPIPESEKSADPYSGPDSALFNISEYLKPYTLDIINFSGEKKNHITNAASTSTATLPYNDNGEIISGCNKQK
ncbi:uncharacterized protein Dere_GG16430 [Drosophila erecta]|uniref:Uncharacterized protein n=1 Tax=Drosophila erecta TaxID=7220 RepID=A0A0Q5ST56_DROER|nr:uncharacterized protein Dere_GG16430 [Drosophila erecta]